MGRCGGNARVEEGVSLPAAEFAGCEVPPTLGQLCKREPKQRLLAEGTSGEKWRGRVSYFFEMT